MEFEFDQLVKTYARYIMLICKAASGGFYLKSTKSNWITGILSIIFCEYLKMGLLLENNHDLVGFS